MNNKDIISTWDKAGQHFENINPVNRVDIEKSILKKAKRSSIGLKMSLYTNVVIQFAIIGLSIVNISLYNSNTLITVISISFIPFMIAILFYGINKIKTLGLIERNDSNIINTLNKKISFCRSMGLVWPLLTAVSYEILVILINMIVDFDNGSYIIHNWNRFILISLVLFIVIFLVNMFGNLSYITAFKLQIRELSEDYSDERFRRMKKIIVFIAVIILSAFLIYGIYIAVR